MVQNKLDLWDVLKKIDVQNRTFYDDLSEEQQKALQPFVIMRWLTGTNNAGQIQLVNEFVNRYAFTFSKHKSLMCKLMTVCTDGKLHRYKWIKPIQAQGSFPLAADTISKYSGISTKYAREAVKILSSETILEYAQQLGCQKEEMTKLKAELKKKDG